MANTDEIAAAVQSGSADILELWQAVRRFAVKQGLRWLRALGGSGRWVAEAGSHLTIWNSVLFWPCWIH